MWQRPGPTEYAPFYEGYIEGVPHDDVLRLLEEQHAEAVKLFSGLKREAALYRYQPDKWSIQEICGHLVDAERVFMYRAMCFARNDHGPLPGMNENAYVKEAGFDGWHLDRLVEEYSHQRNATLAFFSGIPAPLLLRRGIASEVEFTVRALAFIIAGHERHHLRVVRTKYLPH